MKYKVLLARASMTCCTLLLLGLYAPIVSAKTFKITTGKPTKQGKVEIIINGVGYPVTLNNIPLLDAAAKAKEIERQLNVQVAGLYTVTSMGNTVTIKNAFRVVQNVAIKPADPKTGKEGGDTTGEKTTLSVIEVVPLGTISIDYHDVTPAIVALLPEPSIFQAAFSFNGITADADVTFSSTPTIDTLLSSVYTQLSSDLPDTLKDSLSLDLGQDTINFLLPPNSFDVSVSNFSSDASIASSLGIDTESTPEPSTNLSLLAFGIVGCGTLLKRKLG